VEFSPLEIVRAGSSGFVAEIRVQPGDSVAKGDVLAILSNPQLTWELRDLELQIERSETRARMLKREDKLAEEQAEEEKIESLELQYAEKAVEVDALVVRAGQDGVVMGRGLAALVGTYLAKGDEILAIGLEQHKELRLSIAQRDVERFGHRLGDIVKIELGGGQSLVGTLVKLEPQASTIPPHAALGANCGGPLPVAERRQKDESRKQHISHEFLAPRFTGIVPLQPGAARKLYSGQVGEVSFRTYEESFGEHLVVLGQLWLKSKLDLLTGKS
jgi:putative peptide zinc metalloprotease protein